MQALKLPAVRGGQWLLDGFHLFRRNPSLMIFVVFGYWFMLLVLNLVPVVGPALGSICVPALSMGIMNACRAIERRQPVQLDVVVSGFRDRPRPLLQLGVVYLGGTLVILAVATLVDDGGLAQLMRTGRAPAGEGLDSPQLMLALQVALALMVPFLMAFWFAPMLVAWDGVPVGKAVFFSFVASWRNWRAFLVYAALTTAVTILVPGILMALLGGAQPLSRTLATLLGLPLVLMFVPSFFASFYVSYRQVFAAPGADGAGA